MTSDVFSRIEHGRTADAIVQQVELLILEGILRSGDQLPGERELSRTFDVSRPIVREALKVLENRGLLISRHGGGTFVADLIGEVFSQPVLNLISRHRRATHDYLEYRREIEATTAGLAAQRATSVDKNRLRLIVDGMKEAHGKDDFDGEAALDVAFHNAIGEAAHNIILLHTLRSCYRLLSDGVFFNRALVYQHSGSRDNLLAQHVAIHDAIVSGKVELAQKAASRHMEFVAQTLREAEQANDWARVSDLRQRSHGSILDQGPVVSK